MEDIIPTVNVTDEDPQAVVLREAKPKAEAIINGTDGYLLLAGGEVKDGARAMSIVAACSDDDLHSFMCAGMSLLGISIMGAEQAAAIPQEFQQSILLATGLREFNRQVLARNTPPQTPAGDAAPTTH